jgi:nucleotide-binding universal stress UspA family protein
MLVLLHFFRSATRPSRWPSCSCSTRRPGIGANLVGGWLATRFGIARMLAVGLATQIAGFLLLSAVSPGLGRGALGRLGGGGAGRLRRRQGPDQDRAKSAIKLTEGRRRGRLFRWVAWFTGSKNAMKGAGFFLGGLLLEALGLPPALWAMAAALALVLAARRAVAAAADGQGAASRSARELFAKSRGVNLLAAARVFLFGARDVWFVSACRSSSMPPAGPSPWSAASSRSGRSATAWSRPRAAPGPPQRRRAVARCRRRALVAGAGRRAGAARRCCWPACRGRTSSCRRARASSASLFAVNSSVHSYLMLAYAGSEKAAEDVGFYYAANAAGRFGGTLLSGAAFEAELERHGIVGEWRVDRTPSAQDAMIHARYADLVIVGQHDPQTGRSSFATLSVADLALVAGRPVLVVPHAGRFATIGERVIVAWNGSREATRAVHDALPLLRAAKSVSVFSIAAQAGESPESRWPGADIAAHLSRHGVPVTTQHTIADPVSVADALLNSASDDGADLIVMGAYGRSQLRELVLGGVTRDVLRMMTVPVLLSH